MQPQRSHIYIHTLMHPHAYIYMYVSPMHINMDTDMLAPTRTCIIASKYVQSEKEEFIVSHNRNLNYEYF